jgi:hypothetical protein
VAKVLDVDAGRLFQRNPIGALGDLEAKRALLMIALREDGASHAPGSVCVRMQKPLKRSYRNALRVRKQATDEKRRMLCRCMTMMV